MINKTKLVSISLNESSLPSSAIEMFNASVWDKLFAYNDSAVRYCHSKCMEAITVETNNALASILFIIVISNTVAYLVYSFTSDKKLIDIIMFANWLITMGMVLGFFLI